MAAQQEQWVEWVKVHVVPNEDIMASTSTNKQPLLIDHPLFVQQNIISQRTGNNDFWLTITAADYY